MLRVRFCTLGSSLLPPKCQGHSVICSTADFKIYFLTSDLYARLVIFPPFLDRSAVQKLGMETFEEVYEYLKRARHQNAREAEIWEHLETVVPRASDCFEVDQLLYFEELLLTMEGKEPSLQNLHCEAVQKKPVKGTHFCDNPWCLPSGHNWNHHRSLWLLVRYKDVYGKESTQLPAGAWSHRSRS